MADNEGTQIAQAYVQIIPSTKGIQGKLSEELGGEGDKAGKRFGEGFKNFAGTVISNSAKFLGGAIASATGSLTVLSKQAIEGFSNYEQLIGGVQSLFDKTTLGLNEYAESIGKTTSEVFDEWSAMTKNSRTLMNNADNAFRTAGLSANEYYETVTQFSASLISSLEGDTEKAVGQADKAIIDMADNANRFGTDIESIQNAYRGFSKGNYTMLDNLSLGFAGTKDGMEKLLEKAQELSGVEYDIENYSDIIDAIHVIQEDMGIAGTTANEGATTIQGSLAMAQASWKNFISTMADTGADGGSYYEVAQNLVESLTAVFDNLEPVIQTVLPALTDGLITLIDKLAPKIPSMLKSILPSLVKGAMELVKALLPKIPEILRLIISQLPTILGELLGENGTAIGESFLGIFDSLMDGITRIGEAIMPLFDMLLPILAQLMEALTPIISSLMDILVPVIETIVNVIGKLLPVISPLLDLLVAILMPALDLISDLLKPILAVIEWLVDTVMAVAMPVIETAVDYIKQTIIPTLTKVKDTFKTVFSSIWDFIKPLINKIIGGIEGFANGVVKAINFLLSGIEKVANGVGGIIGLDPVHLELSEVKLPRLENGGILDKGQVGLLEGNGAEAVVPLDKNEKWIRAVANEFEVTGDNSKLADMVADAVVYAMQTMKFDATINIEPDDRRLFKVVQQQARIYNNTTGQGAFN